MTIGSIAGGNWSPGDHDELYGEAGNDYLIIYDADGSRPNPYSIADGGDGFDTAELRFSNFGSPLNYVHDTTYAEVHCGRVAGIVKNVEAIVFYSGFADDHITGGPNADAIYGGGGNDVLSGAGGGDLLDGGSGDDALFGGDGDDVLTISVDGNDTFDGGNGTDVLAFSNWPGSAGVTVDLSLSSQIIGGRTIGITAIENLGGTSFDDTLRGSAGNNLIIGGAGTDTLTGGGGNDMFAGSAATLSGDTITDFGFGDSILIANTTLAALSFSLSGSTLTYTGGTLTLANLPNGHFVAREYSSSTAGAGVLLELAPPVAAAHNDFNGDGRSDILWRNDQGTIFDFLGTANGGVVNNGDNSSVSVDPAWQVAATGDFNGDGRGDILWRNGGSGAVYDFLGTTSGGFTSNGDNSFIAAGTGTHVVGVGDFNGDGKSDILWRNDSGMIFDFLGTQNGGFANNGGNSSVTLDNIWQVAGTGDFNGDGKTDILWRNSSSGVIFDMLGTAAGGFTNNGDNSYVAVALTNHVAGIGDFDGDGKSDILWRTDGGMIFDFLGTANGGVTNNGSNSSVALDNSLHVASVGDFNGDGKSDILWRSDSGTTFDFLGNAAGGFANNGDNSYVQLATTLHVQDPFVGL